MQISAARKSSQTQTTNYEAHFFLCFLQDFLDLFYFITLNVLLACMCCIVSMPSVCRDQKRVLDTLKLEL